MNGSNQSHHQNEPSDSGQDETGQQPAPWLSQIQPLPVDHFPRAPASLIYEGYVPNEARPPSHNFHSSPSYNLYLLNHHPAYARSSNGTSLGAHHLGESHQHQSLSNQYSSTPGHTFGSDQRAHNFQYNPYGHDQETIPPFAAPDILQQHQVPQEASIYPDEGLYENGQSVSMVPSTYHEPTPQQESVEVVSSDINPPKRKKRRRIGEDGGIESSKRRTGHRGGWSKNMKLGPRAALEPSEDFVKLHNAANSAFIDERDHEKARDLILEAIAINPEIFSAHSLLAEIYFSQGKNEDAIKVLWIGVHSNINDVEAWREVADDILNRSNYDRQTVLQQTAYCFSVILRKNPKDSDARFQRAACSRELGHYTKALSDLHTLLADNPRNSDLLHTLADFCIEVKDISRAINAYEDAFDYFREARNTSDTMFTWQDVAGYVNLISISGKTGEAAYKLKELARSLVGRHDEVFWNDFKDDDREWDQDHAPRRIQVPQMRYEHHNDSYGEALPLDLRAKLGILRLKQNLRSESISHFEWLEPENSDEDAPVHGFADLFVEVAHALRDAKEHEQALRFYEALDKVGLTTGVDFWLGIGASSYICNKRDQAIRCYEAAKSADPTCQDARTQLAKLYADNGDRKLALRNAREAVRMANHTSAEREKRKYERKEQRAAREAAQRALKQAYMMPLVRGLGEKEEVPELTYATRRGRRKAAIQPAASEPSTKAPKEPKQPKRPRPKRVRPKKLVKIPEDPALRIENAQQYYQTLINNTQAMRDGDDIARNSWMDCAQALIEDFRSNKIFYPSERHLVFQGYDKKPTRLNSRKNVQKDVVEAASEQISDHPEQILTSEIDQDVPLPSVESDIPTEYCQIPFSGWLDIFLEYALLLANSTSTSVDTQAECYTIINAAIDCIVFYHDHDAMFQIYVCYLSCALALSDELTLFNTVLRWFMREYSFCTDTYRLYTAFNLLYDHAPDKNGKAGQMTNAIFRSSPNAKFVFRQLMAIDLNLPADYNIDGVEGPVPEFMRREREHLPKMQKEDGIDPDSAVRVVKPQEMDVVLLTLYAQIMAASGSFPNAISYLYRAHILDPKNTVVLLTIALCYMHQMFKRQNENRHMYMLQGWAFFDEYAVARMEWAEARGPQVATLAKKEIAFNRARCWGMLGMTDLAMRGYEAVLQNLDDKDKASTDDDSSKEAQEEWSMEAAYAMATMYASNGDPETARRITEKWLVIE